MKSQTSSNFGFGLPRSYWDTPHPSKSRTPSSILGVRHSSHLDSPLRAVKRRRLSIDSPQKRRVEKNDNGFKFFWIVDSPPLNATQNTCSDPSHDENPLRELSRKEWKQRSAQRPDSPDTDLEIIDNNSNTNAKSPPSRDECDNPLLLDVSFGQPLEDDQTARLEPILESPPRNSFDQKQSEQSDSKENCNSQPKTSDAELTSPKLAPGDNGKLVPVIRPDSTAKRRKRDYSPSQIVRQGDKKYIRRHGKRKEKYVVHEVRRKKVKKRRKVLKKKKKRKPKVHKQVTRYEPMEIPSFPVVRFSKERVFWSLKDMPHVAVSKFFTNLNASWIGPLIETYGGDASVNVFGFIPRCMKKCLAELNKHIPEIARSCDIVFEDVEKLRRQREEKSEEEVSATTSGNHSKQLPPHWYIDCLKSRRDNLRAYTDSVRDEVKGFDEMWKEIEKPGFLDELFPQLRLELNFETVENEADEEKEDPTVGEWKRQIGLDDIEMQLLGDEFDLGLKLEDKEREVGSREKEIQQLYELYGTSSSTVTKLNRVVSEGGASSSEGANDSVGVGDAPLLKYSRARGSEFPQSDRIIISGFIQALERAQNCEDMDVDI